MVFFASSLDFIRGLLLDVYRRLAKAHNLYEKNKLESRMEMVFEKAELPFELFHILKEHNVEAYQQRIRELIKDKNPWPCR
jgi:hypothetical protein